MNTDTFKKRISFAYTQKGIAIYAVKVIPITPSKSAML